ncbi:MAG: S8 family serine peptidase, partial [Actinomycetes bacterium]
MKRLRIPLVAAMVWVLLLAACSPALGAGTGLSASRTVALSRAIASTPTSRADAVPGVFIVKTRPSAKGTVATLDALPGVSAGDVKSLGDQTAVVTTPKGKSDAQILKELRGSPSVEFAEPDYIRQVSAYAVPPNDPGYASTASYIFGGGPPIVSAKSWWLRDINANTGMNIASLWSSLEAPTFPARATGSAIKVAVIDTGFYMDHPDAGTNIVAGKDEFATYSTATGVRTRDNDVTPVDPAAPLNNVTTASHGTCVAGQISAGTNNGVGVTALTYDTTVLVYKVQGVWTDGNPAGGCPAGSAVILDSAIIDAINDATTAGVKVINMSLGGPAYSQAIQNAIDTAWSHGVLVVAASGNSGTLDGVQYPGANAHVVGVGSYTVTGTPAPTFKAVSSFTDYGVGRDAAGAGANNGRLDILAPGQGIWGLVQPGYDFDGAGTVYEPGYYWWQGTSMASPAFAGMAAMVWRFAPALTADQVANVFFATATDAGSATLGSGYVNPVAAYAKLKTDYPYLLAPASLTMLASTTSTSVPVSWSAVAGTSVSYDISDNGAFVQNVSGLSTVLTLGLGSHFVTVTPRSDYNWWDAATNKSGTVVVTSPPALPGTLSGTVRSGGIALAGATVSVPGTSSAVTASDGTYTIGGITPGT